MNSIMSDQKTDRGKKMFIFPLFLERVRKIGKSFLNKPNRFSDRWDLLKIISLYLFVKSVLCRPKNFIFQNVLSTQKAKHS